MTAHQREMMRNALLQALEASRAYTPTLAVLQLSLRQAGFPRLQEDEVKAELLYLRDKGMAEPAQKVISPENSGWRITAAGRDHLATEGLE